MTGFFSKKLVRQFSNSNLFNILIQAVVLVAPMGLQASLMDQFVLTSMPYTANHEFPGQYSVLQTKAFDTDRIVIIEENEISQYFPQGNYRELSRGLSKIDAAKTAYFFHQKLQSFLIQGLCAIIPLSVPVAGFDSASKRDISLALLRFKNFVVGPNGPADLQEISPFID